jgi:hypothetical protein
MLDFFVCPTKILAKKKTDFENLFSNEKLYIENICPSKQRMEQSICKGPKIDQLNHNKNLKKYW